MQKHLASKNLFSAFFTLITRKESKTFLVKRTIESETDQQLICSFISKHCDPEKVYRLQKTFEFSDGFFVPHFELFEVDKSLFDLAEED